MAKTTLKLFSIPESLKPDWLRKRSTIPYPPPMAEGMVEAPVMSGVQESVAPSKQLDPTLRPGQVVANSRFRIEQLLDDTGSMAFVYKATQLSLAREVVLKVLRMRFDGNERDRERLRSRFEKELKAYGKLNHRNIVTVHDSGWTEDGHPWIAMEFLDGRSLRSDMRRKRIYSQEEMLAIASPVARALSAAHESGIVHNDVKPENIFLLNDGTVKLVDFGTAKFFAEVDKSSGRNLGVDTVIGTPAYMPPERHFVQPSTEDDPRSDLYSLGIVEMEMLTGVNPVTNNDRALTRTQIANKHGAATFQKPIGASIELWAVIEPLLRTDPRRRTSTAREHADQLARVEENQKGPPKSQSVIIHAGKAAQSDIKLLRAIRSAAFGALFGSVLVLCGYSVVFFRTRHWENRIAYSTTASPGVPSAGLLPKPIEPNRISLAETTPHASGVTIDAQPVESSTSEPKAPTAVTWVPHATKTLHETIPQNSSAIKPKAPAGKQTRVLEISEDSPYAPGKP